MPLRVPAGVVYMSISYTLFEKRKRAKREKATWMEASVRHFAMYEKGAVQVVLERGSGLADLLSNRGWSLDGATV